MVFPAQTGVVRLRPKASDGLIGIPRICRGVPKIRDKRDALGLYSPRLRGWSCRQDVLMHYRVVFPAQAGVFPSCVRVLQSQNRIPRVCGGVPG